MNDEEFYDSEIAPELLRLGKKCQDRKLSFVACVEYNPSEQGIGRTEYQAPKGEVSCAMLLVHWAARCKGNVDSLIMAIEKHAREHGHSSMYLKQLGNDNVKYSGNEFAAITVTTP